MQTATDDAQQSVFEESATKLGAFRPARVDDAIERARAWLLARQTSEGYWCGDLEGDATLESYLILLRAFFRGYGRRTAAAELDAPPTIRRSSASRSACASRRAPTEAGAPTPAGPGISRSRASPTSR